jgi:tetratricopeptide (TPR) repeat protein
MFVAASDDVMPPEAELPASAASRTNASADNKINYFYEQSKAAFQQGSYRDATQLAAHAAVDEPKNPNVHLLLVLGMFATGEYRGAAMEAHTVALLNKSLDWATVYGFYNDLEPYKKQLQTLEKYTTDKPKQPEGRFLLGFFYMVGGYRDAAKKEFLAALKLTPRDRVAAQLLKSQGGEIPADIAKQLADMPPLPDMNRPAEVPKPPEPHLVPDK